MESTRTIYTDVLIIGGGTAGCYSALTIRKHSDLSVVIAEKAHIKRSGCLAAGVNALNAYIVPGRTIDDYVDYQVKDANHIVREDLAKTMCEGLNRVTAELERLGLVILKDEHGEYVARGNRNIKINGENIKLILSDAVEKLDHVTIINRLAITDYIVENNTIYGAIGFHIETGEVYEIRASYVIIATGGAAGLYKPNNPGFSRHKMWYSPFNTGAGYAMGIRHGAEMTTFEMRFIALRCKDTIAPTGTIAQGVGAKQVNGHGDVYETKYGLTTSERVYGTVKENLDGNGPCYLDTTAITAQQEQDLLKAYLNMAPSQTLKWIDSGLGPKEQAVEIEGTEPYIVGGHTASGYWVDTKRETTIHNLFAAGDVAGGCPQKYVTGALVEGEIAALAIIDKSKHGERGTYDTSDSIKSPATEVKRFGLDDTNEKQDCGTTNTKSEALQKALDEYNGYLLSPGEPEPRFSVDDLEEAMQKAMDTYAGGISTMYQYTTKQLEKAALEIARIESLVQDVRVLSVRELVFVYELKNRLTVCKTLIAHLQGRKETRWHTFGEYLDYPTSNEVGLHYVNSKVIDGQIQVLNRPLVRRGEIYEHSY